MIRNRLQTDTNQCFQFTLDCYQEESMHTILQQVEDSGQQIRSAL